MSGGKGWFPGGFHRPATWGFLGPPTPLCYGDHGAVLGMTREGGPPFMSFRGRPQADRGISDVFIWKNGAERRPRLSPPRRRASIPAPRRRSRRAPSPAGSPPPAP